MWNDGVEASEEGLQLFANSTSHLLLTHEFNVVIFILVGHQHRLAARNQLNGITRAEFALLKSERLLIAKHFDFVLKQIRQSFVQFRVFVLNVCVLNWHSQNVLVQRTRKVALKQLVIVNCFRNEHANEAEEVQMFYNKSKQSKDVIAILHRE